MQEEDPLGLRTKKPVTQEAAVDEEDPLGLRKKKGPTLPSFGEQQAQQYDQSLATAKASSMQRKENAPAASVVDLPKRSKDPDQAEKDKQNQKLIKYYDNTNFLFDEDPDKAVRLLYKNWNAANGTMDRYSYLEQKAKAESGERKEELQIAASGLKRLQEERRAAASAGDMNKYSELNDLIQKGAEYVRTNKVGLDQDYNTETGLKLWEESVGFTSQLLNAKMEDLLKDPTTNEKLTRLFAINEEMKNSPNPELEKEYTTLLMDPKLAQVNRLSKHGQKLIDDEKSLAVKYPEIFKERLNKKDEQQKVDSIFEAMKGTNIGVSAGMLSQVGRSATGFVADLVKLPAIVDFNNEYGWQDKWTSAVDKLTDIANDQAFPIPSEYNKPLVYEDEKGNTVFRTDLLLPKTAKVAGDMAALLFGASKISGLGKAVGISNKVSTGIGLFSSSYIQSFDDYKKSGMEAGMAPLDAQWFATSAATVTSALELISPNKYLWANQVDDIAKSVVKNVTAGMSKKAALKEAFKTVPKEIFGENLQEISQQIGDLAVEKGSEILTGNDYYDHNAKDIMNEAIETIALTTIVAGAPAGIKMGVDYNGRDNNYKDAIRLVAENKDKYLPLLQDAFKVNKNTPEEVAKVMADVDATPVPLNGAPLYVVNGETVDRSAITDKIESGDTNGVYVANDNPLEQQLKNSATERARMTLPFLQGIPKYGAKLKIDALVKSGDIEVDGTQVTAKTTKGAEELNNIVTAAIPYLKGIAKEKAKVKPVLPEAETTADGKKVEPTTEEIAKAEAHAKIVELVKSGDLSFDGKRVTVLTEKGGQEFSTIYNEMNRKSYPEYDQLWNDEDRSLSEAVHENGTPEKSEQTTVSATETGNVIPKTETVKEEPAPTLIEGENLDLKEFTKNEQDPTRKRIGEVLSKAKQSLSKISPDVKVALYEGPKAGKELLKKVDPKTKLPKGASGFYANNTIGIDLSQADASTAFHEAFHPIVDALQQAKPELFTKLSEDAAKQKLDLADGSVSTYGENTGSKEEALVDFLADFADGEFDKYNNSKSITQKVKDIIEQILEAVGLKSTDFDVDLNKIEDLRDFADQMATAISKGKTINLEKSIAKSKTKFQNLKAKKKIREYEKKSGKKVNKTAKRVAYDAQTWLKDVAVDVVMNPADYAYDPQKYSDIETYLESLSDADLMNMINQNNSLAVLAGIKLMGRQRKNNQSTIPIFKKLREIGTSVGQLLRQYGELKTKTPEGIVQTVLDNLESLNLTLTDPQKKELEALADNHVKALDDKEAKRVAYINNPSAQTDKDLGDAQKKLDTTFEELNKFIGKVTPFGLDSLIPMMLQGVLLTTKSIVANVVGNTAQLAPRQVELFAGDLANYVVERMQGKHDAMNPFELYYSATLNGIIASGTGVVGAIKDVVKGQGSEFNSSLEVQRNLKPLQAIWQLINKQGRATLPVNSKGKVPAAVYIEKILEASIGGWTAEAGFRALYATDKPFKDGARAGGTYRMFAATGGKTSADYRKFMANLTTDQKNKIENYAREATFSDKRTFAKIGDKLVRAFAEGMDLLAEHAPNENFRYAAKTLGRTFLKANIPFVQVPANLIQHLVELVLPPLTLYGSLKYAILGDTRKSAQLFTRAMTGVGMHLLANMLYDAGITIASGEDDEENVRQAKHEVARPNSINMSALARFAVGGDPTFQEGDDIRDLTKLGLLGMYLAYNAEWNEGIKRDLKVTRSEADYTDLATKSLGSAFRTSFEMPFLQGSFVALKSMSTGDFSNYLPELTNTFSALILPNQYAATFTRPRADYILRADDKSVINEIMEKQSIKIFPNMNNNIAGVYPIIGMFGDPVSQTPKGNNPLLYHLFDITNNERITDPLALEVFNLMQRTGELKIGTPSATITIRGKSYTMEQQDYVYLQMLAGRYKRLALNVAVSDPEWKTRKDEHKLIITESINESANSAMRDFMSGKLHEGVANGRIILDEKMGTYKYTSPSEFDFDFAKKAFEKEED